MKKTKDSKPFRYLVNLRSEVLHKLPTLEKCNVDQIPAKFKARLQHATNARRCKHCFA